MNRIWAMLLLFAMPAVGQTFTPATGYYPSSAEGLGMTPGNYYSFDPYDDLLGPMEASFQGVQRAMVKQVSSGTTTSFVTGAAGYYGNTYDYVGANAAVGATVYVLCHYNSGGGCPGGAYGQTSTITANTTSTFGTSGPTWTISPALTTAITPGDIVSISYPLTGVPFSQFTGSNPTHWGFRSGSGSITWAYDTTAGNLPPAAVTGLPQVPGVTQLSNTGLNTLANEIDTGGPAINVLMNGTVSANIMLNLISGSCTIAFDSERLGGQTYISSTTPQTITSGWHTYSATGTASETATTAYTGGIYLDLNFNGTCAFDITSDPRPAYPTLSGAASVAADNVTIVPHSHANASPFSDQMVNIYSRGHYDSVRYLYVSGSSAIEAGCSLYNLLQPIAYRQQCNVSETNYTSESGVPSGIDDVFKLAQAAGAHRVKYTPSPHWLPADYTNLMRYIGAPCSDAYGQIRCNLGQTAPWTSVFSEIDIGWNETWNAADTGQYLGGTPFVSAIGMAQIMATTIKASPYYTSVVKTEVPMQAGGVNSPLLATYGGTAVDLIDMNAYHQVGTTTPTQPLMFQNALAETYANTTDSTLLQYGIGAAGVPVSTYETAPGYLGGACTTPASPSTTCAGLPEGLGSGITEATTFAYLQRRWPGIFMYPNQFVLSNGPSQNYTSSATTNPATTIALWSKIPNIRGAGAFPDPSYFFTSLYNQAAVLGTGINVTASGQPTFNSTAANAIPAESNVPLVDFWAYCPGTGMICASTQRAYFIFNGDSTSHTVTLGGAFALSGTVTKTVGASSNTTPSLADNNRTINTQVVGNTTTTASAATSYTIPAYSVMLLQGSTPSPTGGWVIPMYYTFDPDFRGGSYE